MGAHPEVVKLLGSKGNVAFEHRFHTAVQLSVFIHVYNISYTLLHILEESCPIPGCFNSLHLL